MKNVLYVLGALVLFFVAFKVLKFALSWLVILALVAGVAACARFYFRR